MTGGMKSGIPIAVPQRMQPTFLLMLAGTPVQSRITRFLVASLILIPGLCAWGQNRSGETDDFFESKVRPVLAGRCVECHGPAKASGGLRLDSREALFKGGDSGLVIIPGDVENSLLAKAIKHDENESLQMPPKKSLPPETVADLHAWIAAGAKWPQTSIAPIISDKPHWAFAPLKTILPPDDPTGWSQQPLDRFIAAARHEHSVHQVRDADKHTLLRRAYFDLIGLPPPPEKIEAFLADQGPDAFARVVDELLASPRYGERWGRHWLDLVRYADTAGDNSDYPIPQAYLYRDYCIDAFNSDLPYDRFLHEQLAGDILARQAPKDDFSRLVIATGFIAQSKRLGTRELEDMHLIIEDTLTTLGPVMLGLSIRCARCHDHKYEPLTQHDYYALYGFFASTQYPFAGAEEVRKQTKFAPLIHPDDLQERLARHDASIARIKVDIDQQEKNSQAGRRAAELEQAVANLEEKLKGAETSAADQLTRELDALKTEQATARDRLKEQLKPLQDELARLQKADPLLNVPTAYAVGELTPVDARLQKSGNPRTSGNTVPRGVPKILAAGDFDIPPGTSGRLQLAQWMTEQASALTARVMANRIWQYHLGKPIVPTPSDFGFRGTPPTHPELLDWLSNEFLASGWSLKAMHRQIMGSRTYQLSSEMNAQNAENDPDNVWYWRFNRMRLDAEALRDSTLALGQTLDLGKSGPHPFPEPSTWRFSAHKQFNQVCYPSNHRSVYLMVQRLHAHPYLSLFNGPDASLSTPTRDTSTVPLQALFLLNDEMIHNQAAGFAKTLIQQQHDPAGRLQLTFQSALGRSPSESELAGSLEFLDRYQQSLKSEGCAADKLELESWSALARTILRSNEYFFVD